MTETLTFVDVASLDDPAGAWEALREGSDDSAFVNSYLYHRYALAAAADSNVADHSFIALSGDTPVALAPLHFNDVKTSRPDGWTDKSASSDQRTREACFYGGPLPWPCIARSAGDIAEQRTVEDQVFTELERRAHEGGAGRLRVVLFPAVSRGDERERYLRTVRSRRYIDASYRTHEVLLSPDALAQVRERYRRNVRKFGKSFDVDVLEGDAVTPEVEQAYFELHVADAGGQFRPRESYARQLDICRARQGFCVMARDKASGRFAGGLLITLCRTLAIDWSVGVHPDYQTYSISHLLKWKTIETLVERGYHNYELGIVADSPTATWQPSDKHYGISFFKSGWSRDRERTILLAEKYFDAACLRQRFAFMAHQLSGYFGLAETERR